MDVCVCVDVKPMKGRQNRTDDGREMAMTLAAQPVASRHAGFSLASSRAIKSQLLALSPSSSSRENSAMASVCEPLPPAAAAAAAAA
eukprot:SAG22_NODE_16577_length_322_cov_0.932735_1_plen_86_part_10